MKIEILTRNTAKKAEVLTFLKKLKDFETTGNKFFARDVEVEIDESYILLTVQKPWLADDFIRLLFDVRAVPFSSGFYEIAAGQKIIITCRGMSVAKVVSRVEVLEHLDLEAAELAGSLETRWNSRDVGIIARYQIILQGGVAVAKIKLDTHFRESAHQCREVISQVSLAPGLAAFCAELNGLAPPPRASTARAVAGTTIGVEEWADFINNCPGKITYGGSPGSYLVELPGKGNLITVAGNKGSRAELKICLEEPWQLDVDLVRSLNSMTGTVQMEVGMEVENLMVRPDDLLKGLGFKKEKEFTIFSSMDIDIQAKYDIGTKLMTVRAQLPWNKFEASRELFGRLDAFTGRVMAYAV